MSNKCHFTDTNTGWPLWLLQRQSRITEINKRLTTTTGSRMCSRENLGGSGCPASQEKYHWLTSIQQNNKSCLPGCFVNSQGIISTFILLLYQFSHLFRGDIAKQHIFQELWSHPVKRRVCSEPNSVVVKTILFVSLQHVFVFVLPLWRCSCKNDSPGKKKSINK